MESSPSFTIPHEKHACICAHLRHVASVSLQQTTDSPFDGTTTFQKTVTHCVTSNKTHTVGTSLATCPSSDGPDNIHALLHLMLRHFSCSAQ